jgi:hypothetical protein
VADSCTRLSSIPIPMAVLFTVENRTGDDMVIAGAGRNDYVDQYH